jgi:DNA-binding transcriptional LysR family regulator
MTIRQLRIFAAVANHLSITKAAKEIQIRQPSVSRQLKQLEEELKVKLHTRKEQGIKLTEEGLLFLKVTEPILQDIAKIKNLFIDKSGQLKPAFLKLASVPSPSTSFLPQVLGALRKIHPHINPILRIADSPEIEQMVLNRHIEIGVTNERSSNPKIISERLCSEKVVAIVSSSSPWAKKRKLDDHELSQMPIVVRDTGTIYKHLQAMGVKLNICMRCEPIGALKSAVASGLGMGFFHRNIVDAEIKRGDVKVINIPQLRKVEMTWFLQYLSDAALSREANDLRILLHRTTSKLKTVKNVPTNE